MPVTAFPVILIDSAAGSDSAASGAGPSTALTGTAGATDGAGTTVTLDSGTDLTNVATDGSHVLYFVDTTAGHRRFTAINGKAGSGGATPTVTVEQALTISLSGKSWAIGGKRASIGSATSSLLISNNAASGDAMPGWVMQLQSAHSETIAATVTMRRSGDATSGPITLRGAAGAATLPLLIFSNNGEAINSVGAVAWQFCDFEMQNSNATKTASYAFRLNNGAASRVMFRRLKISDSTNKFWRGFAFSNCIAFTIDDCYIGNCADVGILIDNISTVGALTVKNCEIFSCTSHGVKRAAGNVGVTLLLWGNLIRNNGGDGINDASTDTADNISSIRLIGNTFDSNTGDGVEIAGTSQATLGIALVANNIFSNNGGFGLNFSGAGVSDITLAAADVQILNNDFFTNTSGKYNGITVASSQNEQTSDPTYVGGGNYAIGTNLKGLGYPLGGTLKIGTYGGTYSYVDIGAAQRQEAGGGGGGSVIGSSVITARPAAGR